jgi:hydrogenase nickel incorporation protein HypB
VEAQDEGAALHVQLVAQGAPHLSPSALWHSLAEAEVACLDFLVVKNVADFVCPATYRLGTHVNVRVTTVLERDARPHDQPQLFEGLDALVVNMIDRREGATFDLARFRAGLDVVNPNLVVLPLSCRTGEGVERWARWLMLRRELQFYSAPPRTRWMDGS